MFSIVSYKVCSTSCSAMQTDRRLTWSSACWLENLSNLNPIASDTTVTCGIKVLRERFESSRRSFSRATSGALMMTASGLAKFTTWQQRRVFLTSSNRIHWWQSRTVSAAPVAGWTSSAGEGSIASAGPFSPWTQCDFPTSGPEKLWCPGISHSHIAVHDGEWGESGGFLQKSMIISTVLSVFSSRLLRLHQTASSLTSCL